MSLKPEDLGYLAGIIDGEGCIQLRVNTNPKHRHNASVSTGVVISNTNPAILLKCTAIIQNMKIGFKIRVLKQQPNQKGPVTQIAIERQSEQRKLIIALKPIITGKLTQLKLLEMYLGYNGFAGKQWSPNERREFSRLMRQANSRYGDKANNMQSRAKQDMDVRACVETRDGAPVKMMDRQLKLAVG